MGNIKRVTPIGEFQTYDLEVDHPDHQFYLSNGILTSNSHSILYSMTSYKTAYLKAHFPIEFLLANLMAEVKSNNPDAKNDIEKIKKELRKNKVKIIKPNINKSKLSYTIENGNQLITGFDAIKFVKEEAIKEIIEKRPFKDFFDFMTRISSKVVRSNVIQALAACGVLDDFNISRKLIFLYCQDYRKKLQTWLKKHDPSIETFNYPWPMNEKEWSIQELYALEQYYLGESFICQPPVAYGDFFKDSHKTVEDIKKAKDKTYIDTFKGIVRDFYEFRIKKETSKNYGKPMVKATLEDKFGDQVSCTIFTDRWEKVQERIKQISKKSIFDSGIALYFSGNTNNYEDDMGIILDTLFNIAIPPPLPTDLKAKKINLKEARSQTSSSKDELWKPADNPETLLLEIEDALYDEGLIDLDSNSDED